MTLYADWDKDGWNLFDGSTETRAVPKGKLLEEQFWASIRNGKFRVEKEHFAPKDKYSLAQVYTQGELDRLAFLAEVNNVHIQLLPHSQAFRVRLETGYVTSEGEHDKSHMSTANYKFYSSHPEIALQDFPCILHESRRRAAEDIIRDSNGRLNIMRADDDKYSGPACDHAKQIIYDNYDALTEHTRELFGIKKYKVGAEKGHPNYSNLKMNSIMSIYTMVYDEKGNLRRNKYGQFIGVDTIWRILRQHPYKGTRGGTARSNIMWHLRRNALKPHTSGSSYRKTDNVRLETYSETNKAVSNSIKELIRLFRDNE